MNISPNFIARASMCRRKNCDDGATNTSRPSHIVPGMKHCFHHRPKIPILIWRRQQILFVYPVEGGDLCGRNFRTVIHTVPRRARCFRFDDNFLPLWLRLRERTRRCRHSIRFPESIQPQRCHRKTDCNKFLHNDLHIPSSHYLPVWVECQVARFDLPGRPGTSRPPCWLRRDSRGMG